MWSKPLNNNFKQNLIYEHLTKKYISHSYIDTLICSKFPNKNNTWHRIKFWQNKESVIFLYKGYNSIKTYKIKTCKDSIIDKLHKSPIIKEWTSLPQWNHCIRMNHCVEIKHFTEWIENKLTDWYKFACWLLSLENYLILLEDTTTMVLFNENWIWLWVVKH